jgi:hypothetical protein
MRMLYCPFQSLLKASSRRPGKLRSSTSGRCLEPIEAQERLPLDSRKRLDPLPGRKLTITSSRVPIFMCYVKHNVREPETFHNKTSGRCRQIFETLRSWTITFRGAGVGV